MKNHRNLNLILAVVAITGVMALCGAPKAAASQPVVSARNGMVVAANPLASQAGLQMLVQGGNAVDAAIATAAVMAVVEPQYSSLAAGGMMLIYDASSGNVVGLNANAPSPAAATIDKFTSETARRGYLAGNVPAALKAWDEALKNYGTMTLDQVLAPAIHYAEKGFPMTESLSNAIRSSEALLSAIPTSAKVFLPGGRVPEPGEIFVQEDMANVMKRVAAEGTDVFYKGDIAREMAQFYQENGGLFTYEDFANFEIEWTVPLKGNYRGYDIYAPGGEFCAAMLLQQLNVVESFDIASMGHNTPETLHLMIETTKLAGLDRDKYVADPRFVDIPEQGLISKEYAKALRAKLNLEHAATGLTAGDPDPWEYEESHTTHLGTVDRWGNMVSYTTSTGSSFGTSVVVGNTGTTFNNGMGWMELDPDHINCLAPNKRPMNNICPVFIFKDGEPIINAGTPGGNYIWGTMFQFIVNMIDFGMTPQRAVEVPRYLVRQFDGTRISLFEAMPEETRKGLADRGHSISTSWSGTIEVIMRNPETGVLTSGLDPTRDSSAAAW
ncbi:MAG: gamma-glutamyltransferase [Firmicutes bacterium]|jgi:gamma-glutamyltranspeptidase/glutathione hydrolase|nr:gamma-glutamyltransferase [Bacillota bacterium]MDD4793529.1 gamma-glutamyltransferase [Bacillota bacterium]